MAISRQDVGTTLLLIVSKQESRGKRCIALNSLGIMWRLAYTSLELKMGHIDGDRA